MSGPRAAVDGVRDLARDVQRFGLLSASSVVDRYLDLVDRAVGGAPAETAPQPGRPTDPFTDGDVSALVESAARVAQTYLGLLEAATKITEPTARVTAVTLVLDAVRPGDVAQGAIWVHNPGPEPTRGSMVTISALVGAHGACLDATRVGCVPSEVPAIAPGESAQVDVSVRVPDDQPPGHYHGVVIGSLSPGRPIQVSVEVLAS